MLLEQIKILSLSCRLTIKDAIRVATTNPPYLCQAAKASRVDVASPQRPHDIRYKMRVLLAHLSPRPILFVCMIYAAPMGLLHCTGLAPYAASVHHPRVTASANLSLAALDMLTAYMPSPSSSVSSSGAQRLR